MKYNISYELNVQCKLANRDFRILCPLVNNRKAVKLKVAVKGVGESSRVSLFRQLYYDIMIAPDRKGEQTWIMLKSLFFLPL